MNTALFVWALLIFLVGLVQVYMGLGAPINQLPDAVGVEGAGVGGYDYDGIGVQGIFRPTSIFMHTGRLGQFAFCASLVLVVSAILSGRKKGYQPLIFASLGVVLVLLSGQRAALMFLLLSTLALLMLARNASLFYRAIIVILIVCLISLSLNQELAHLVWSRFSSVVLSIDDRFLENSSDAAVALERFLYLGKGLGYFSFGSSTYGGELYYVHMSQYGYAGNENSWLRVQGETGVVGLALFLFLVFWVACRSVERFRQQRASEMRAFHFVSAATTVSLAAWAFTHDVFANYLLLVHWFMFFGASSGGWYRQYREEHRAIDDYYVLPGFLSRMTESTTS